MKKISLSSWAIPQPLDQLVAGAKKIGYDGISLGGFPPFGAHPDLVDTQAKKDAQRRLTTLMNAQLKLSEVDTGHQTSLLHLIGWAAKAGPKRGLPPGQPRTLRAILEDGGTLALDWKSPVSGEGHGRVRAYLIERREQPAPNAPLTEWTQIAVALETNITLTRQPRAQQLEFRVVPVNNGGTGTPSNTASVVM